MKQYKYIIKKKEDEIELYYQIRKFYIDTQNPKNMKEFKLCNMYSNILINILFLQCRYQSKTENNIKEFLGKYYDKIVEKINKRVLNDRIIKKLIINVH